MAIVAKNMARPEGDDLTAETVTRDIKMPPELQQAYERVVIAGMKVMFSKETHQLMLKEFERGGPLSERLGNGIAGLMLLLFTKSNQTIPPQVMIPAGVNLLMQAVDFIRAAQLEPIKNADVGAAMQIMIATLLEKFGVSNDKLMSLVDAYDQGGIDAAKQQLGA